MFAKRSVLACVLATGSGTQVCYTGYVMDTYCIKRGTLLDNPSLDTLANPSKHSVHCLVDVPPCYNSGFELLSLDPAPGSSQHSRAYKLDATGNTKALAAARAEGLKGGCTTCTNTSVDAISKGYKATVVGTVTDASTSPPTLAVTDVLPASTGCSSVDSGTQMPTAVAVAAVAQGAEVCYTGFVMDKYCLRRGTLLDNPTLETLSNPTRHTLHCLVDPPQCYNSGFELLTPDPAPGSSAHCRAYQLDAAGNAKALAAARAEGLVGGCTTCTNTSAGAPSEGYRATVIGTVADARTSPPTLAVTAVLPALAGGCEARGRATVPPAAAQLKCTDGENRPFILAHGTLMLLSWGLMLPSGVVAARMLRHRPPPAGGGGPIWFRLHRTLQPLGLVLAVAGWAVALSSFHVLDHKAKGVSMIHAALGMLTMVLGILQPINAFFRPHNPPQGQPKAPARVLWERLHKGSGRLCVFTGLVTVALGTLLAKSQQVPGLLYAFMVCIVLLVLFIVLAVRDAKAMESHIVAMQPEVQQQVAVSNS